MPLSYYIGPTGCAWSPLSCPRAESAPQGMAASVTPDDTDAQEDEEDDPYWDYPPSYTGQFAWWFENRLAAYEARLIGFPQRSSALEEAVLADLGSWLDYVRGRRPWPPAPPLLAEMYPRERAHMHVMFARWARSERAETRAQAEVARARSARAEARARAESARALLELSFQLRTDADETNQQERDHDLQRETSEHSSPTPPNTPSSYSSQSYLS